MLFMLLLNLVQSLTDLTFCAQWMSLAALLEEHIRSKGDFIFSDSFHEWKLGED